MKPDALSMTQAINEIAECLSQTDDEFVNTIYKEVIGRKNKNSDNAITEISECLTETDPNFVASIYKKTLGKNAIIKE